MVRSVRNDPAVVEHQNLVRVRNAGHALGDDHHGGTGGAALELRLTRENFEQEKAFKRIQEMHRELNNEMEKLEQQFNSSKYDFITFLTAMS